MAIMLAKEVSLSEKDLLIQNTFGDRVDCMKLFQSDLQAMEPKILTAEEEVILGQRLDAGTVAKIVLDAYGEQIVPEDRIALSQKVDEGNHARETFFVCNQGLSVKMAYASAGQGVPFLDLVHEGDTGILEAIDRWEWQLGNKFSTYATHRIRKNIRGAVKDAGRAIRIPRWCFKELTPYLRTVQALTVDAVAPSDIVVAEKLNVPVKRVEWYKKILKNEPLSIDEPAFTDDRSGKTVGETIAEASPSVYRQVAQNDQFVRTRRAVDMLPSQLRSVMILRFGFFDGKSWTQEHVAELLGKTRQRVNQLEMEGVRALRWYNALHNQELYPDKQFAKKAQTLQVTFYDSKEAFEQAVLHELDGVDTDDGTLLKKYFSFTCSANARADKLAKEEGVKIGNMVARLRSAFRQIFLVENYIHLVETLTDETRGQPKWLASS